MNAFTPASLIGRVFRVHDEDRLTSGLPPYPICGVKVLIVQDITGDGDWWRPDDCVQLLHVTAELLSHPGPANYQYHLFERFPDGAMTARGREIVFDDRDEQGQGFLFCVGSHSTSEEP